MPLLTTGLTTFSIDFGYDCRSVLKHDLKSYDIFCDVHDSRKSAVCLSHATKPYRVNRPLGVV